jgi:hypothetical protein
MMVLTDISFERVDWTHLAQDRVHWPVAVNMAMNVGSHTGRGTC